MTATEPMFAGESVPGPGPPRGQPRQKPKTKDRTLLPEITSKGKVLGPEAKATKKPLEEHANYELSQ